MSIDTKTTERIASLEPTFGAQVKELIAKVEGATGRLWGVTAGRRTLKEQGDLYAQGRTMPGKVVTMAKPGSSAHNFGLAADLWPLTANGSDYDWGAPDLVFRKLAELAVGMGLTAGYFFHSIHDAPHIEHPSWKQAKADWEAGKK